MQLNLLSDAENDIIEPKLDDIFAQLVVKSNEEVWGRAVVGQAG